MFLNIDTLLALLDSDLPCPHTGEKYDCARCKDHELIHFCEPPARGHCNLCITHPLDGRNWNALLAYFPQEVQSPAKDLLTQLLQRGVECIPIDTNCDREHFCFRFGCTGNPEKEERQED
jgi:hypothetical protein